jgi:hypothetical protein
MYEIVEKKNVKANTAKRARDAEIGIKSDEESKDEENMTLFEKRAKSKWGKKQTDYLMSAITPKSDKVVPINDEPQAKFVQLSRQVQGQEGNALTV